MLGGIWRRSALSAVSIGQKLRDLAVSESGFVFDPYSGATFSVNATGMCLLEGLKEGLDRQSLMARLEDRFETEGAELSRDVDEFLELLRTHAILPRDAQL